MRQPGGGSEMIFAAFSSMGKSEIAFLSGRVCSNKYITITEKYLKPFASQFHGIDFVYQQDNASIHVSQVSRRYFSKENIRLLPWPARSPDLNPIENLWGYIVHNVYVNGRQFSNVEELKSEILHVWNKIEISYLKKLVNSMKERCIMVISSHGNSIKY